MKKAVMFLVLCAFALAVSAQRKPVVGFSADAVSAYVFPLGVKAYMDPCLQYAASLSYDGWSLISWSSKAFDDGAVHEWDLIMQKSIRLARRWQLSVSGMVWVYPDGTLGAHPDFVSLVELAYTIPLGQDALRLSLTRSDIYAYKDMQKGSGYYLAASRDLCSFGDISFSGKLKTFIGDGFYVLDGACDGFDGMLYLSATIRGSWEVASDLSLNGFLTYQEKTSEYESVYNGFIGGIGFSYSF